MNSEKYNFCFYDLRIQINWCFFTDYINNDNLNYVKKQMNSENDLNHLFCQYAFVATPNLKFLNSILKVIKNSKYINAASHSHASPDKFFI